MVASQLKNKYSPTEKILIFLISVMLLDYNATGQYFGYIIIIYILSFFDFYKWYLNSYYKILLSFGIINGTISIIDYGFSAGLGEVTRLIFIPIALFFSGMILAKDKSKFLIVKTIVFLMVIYSSRALISVLIDIYMNGFSGVRNIEIWASGTETETNATNIFSLVVLNLSGVILIFIPLHTYKEKLLKYFLIVTGFLTILATLRIGSRTGIVTLILTGIFMFIITFKKINIKLKIVIILSLLLATIVVFNINFDIANSAYLDSYQSRIGDSEYGANTAGGRLFIWQYYLSQIPTHILGNIPDFNGIVEAKYAHNLFLDIARKTGIIPMIIMLILTVYSIKILFKNLKMGGDNLLYIALIGSMFIEFWSIFLVEPVLDGMYMLYFFYVFYIGLIYPVNNNLHSQIQ